MNRHAKASSAGPSTHQANGSGAVIRGALALALALGAFAGFGAPAATAAAPTIKAFAAGPVSSDRATINGEVNALGSPTTYWFEWGAEDCEASSCQSTAHASAGFDERQRVVSNATGGQFTLTFEGQTTPDLAINASLANVEAALQALSTIGPGNVSVRGESPGYLIAFTGALANADVPPITAAYGTVPLTRNEGADPAFIEVEAVSRGGYGNGAKHASRLLSGLQPETIYHFRLVAESGSTTIDGPDGEFTTAAPEAPCTNPGMPGTDFLPDCRAYEMVSPTEKNGADVIPNSYKTFAAEVGDGVSYPSLGGFGDVKGTSVDVQYLSRRSGAPGTNGWATHSINPLGHAPNPLRLIVAATVSGYQALAPDLSDGIYRASGTLDDSPNVAAASNLYRLRDLKAEQPQLDLLSPSAAPINGITSPPMQNRYAGASKDLSHTIFQSPYDLTGNGSFTEEPGYLYEYADGVGLRKVGRIPTGSASECDEGGGSPCEEAAEASPGLNITLLYGGTAYPEGMISDDGSRIIFKTPPTEAASESGNIYMREDGARTYQLNASEKTTPGAHADAQAWAMSADGSRAFFTTDESLVDEDGDGGHSDLYMYEVDKPTGHRLTLLSVDDEPADGDSSASSVVGTSEDGHYVYFVAAGQLVAGESSNAAAGLYLWHDGQISYIGAFEGTAANLNTPATSSQGVNATKTSRVSPDGRSLLFMSTHDGGFAGRGGYPGYDNAPEQSGNGFRELYLYSVETGSLTCVSCNPQEDIASADALTDENPGVSGSTLSQHLSHALSADGRHVFFSTKESLVSEDTNGVSDAYEYDVASGTLHLISSGTSSTASYFMDASPDGRDVFFDTRERLVGWDVDGSYDLYDARIGGGFPEPVPVPAPCQGESCLSSPKPTPSISPAVSGAVGPGNQKPACPKGSRRVRRGSKSRCAAKKAHKKHAEHRKADNNRRAGR